MTNTNLTTAPYAVASLVLGISSLVTGCLMIGLVLGIVGLVLANKGTKEVVLAPDTYSGTGMLNAGRITSIIGIILGAVNTIGGLIAMAITGGSILWMLDLMEDFMYNKFFFKSDIFLWISLLI